MMAIPAKSFAWSFSALNDYERCAKKYYHERIAKDVRQETTSAGDWGGDAHKALEERIVKKRPLPMGMGHYDRWARMVLDAPGQTFGEQKTAINRHYQPTDYWANDVWLRAQADALKVNGSGAAVWDWKFGRYTDSWQDQGLINAMMVFCQLPQVQVVGVQFVWFKESGSNPPVSERAYTRQSILDPWQALVRRVGRLELAVQRVDFPPTENFLCRRFCPVTTCPYNGRRSSASATGAGPSAGASPG